MNKDRTISKRFWAKVNKTTTNGCWEWTGSIKRGYGQIKMSGRPAGAHRVSWLIHNGAIPTHDSYHGTCVLHKCDNPKCVNPEHLFLGTCADNAVDKSNKNRCVDNRGERHGGAKLKNADIIAIRKHHPTINKAGLAKMFGVSRTTVAAIISRKSWSHV